MIRENKIKKLKELGIYDNWYNNTMNDIRPSDPDSLLNDEMTWNSFISCSFMWSRTPEKHNFWLTISNK